MAHQHDHELKVDSTTDQFNLVRDENGSAMYQVIEEVPQYQPVLQFAQTDWIGGHGQYTQADRTRYFEGQSIDTTQPGRVCLGPLITEVKEADDTALDAAPVCFLWAETAGKWLCATSGKVYIYGTKWTAATTTVAGILQMVEFKGVIYAARGATGAYMYSTDGDTWTATDLSDSTAYGFLVAPNPAGTAENLWKYKTPNELSRTTDGRTAAAGGVAWESSTYVGETANNITNIFLNGDKLYVGKEDGLYSVDSGGGVHPELPDELKVSHSTDNFKHLTNWQTSTYFSILRGMGEMTTAETYRPMGPLTEIDDIGKVGDIVGLSADKDWLYVAVDEGTNTHIYKGRETLIDNRLRWEWCPWVFLGTNACATIRVAQHTTTDRRLWFGYGTTTAYVILSDNPTSDSLAKFAPSGWVRMSYTYGSDPNWDKLFQSAVLEVKGGASGETVAVSYRKDTDTSTTTAISAATTNGVYETNFSAALACKRIQFQLDLASDTNTATPEVTYFQAKGTEKPTTVRIHEATYSLGDRPADRVKTLRTFLRGGRTSTSLIKFADLRFGQKTSGSASGDYVWCVMLPGYPKEIEIIHEKNRQPELALQVRLMEVSFTIS